MVQSNRDGVCADDSGFAGGAAGAKIIDVDESFDDEPSAKRASAFLNHAFEQGR
jgi:hypothetical protein